jgi:hypothetical protein
MRKNEVSALAIALLRRKCDVQLIKRGLSTERPEPPPIDQAHADTVGAVTGRLACAHYGLGGIL